MLNLEVLVVITNRGTEEGFLSLFNEVELPLSLAAFGRGTATREILDTFSLTDTEKTVLFSLGESDLIRKTVRMITRRLGINAPGTSVVMTIPLGSVASKKTATFLAVDKPVERKEYPMTEESAFELIIVISNEGYSHLVMDAARDKGGATGGTILHARGTGQVHAQKFFGISISDEKEMIFIACRTRCRNRIMQAIIEDAGQETKAKSIVFSVPLSSVAGLWMLQEDEETDGEG
ncbi:MAG: P-II family nitrogen regulator [Lachnospiraceae bacterium]|nr:P-II family nitrogen regulator [Lachnospiraceae bacterium]